MPSPADITTPLAKSLAIVLDLQALNSWCWAAVAASVHNQQRPTTVTQFEVAALVLKNAACGTATPPAACDVPKEVRVALVALQLTVKRTVGSLLWSEVKGALDADKPIVVRIEWKTSKRAHFVILAGYDANKSVVVLDPELGARLVPHATFPNAFRKNTSWTHTYVVG